MESRIGLDYIVENPEYTAKLATALDTNNVTVKKQVLELLSALCVYNLEGHARALDTLQHYKDQKNERYRLQIVIRELQWALSKGQETADYQTAIVAFINCLIISTPQLRDRIRIRNEFIGLKLLPILNELRKRSINYADLGVQLDVFDEQRENDESQILDVPFRGVDISSHVDVFYAILRQVSDTPQEIPFLSVLQHLLRIDPREAVSDIIWDTAETLVHRSTLLENRQDASRLLRTPSVLGQSQPRDVGLRVCCCGRKPSLGPSNVTSPTSVTPPPPPPPPPPPASQHGCNPPPPPPPPPPPLMGVPPPPVPPAPFFPPNQQPAAVESAQHAGKRLASMGNNGSTNAVDAPPPPPVESAIAKLLPQQETPTPKAKMKTINWNKIPDNKVVGRHNIWSLVARSHQNSPMPDLDWSEMEGLFCQQAPMAPISQSGILNFRLGQDTSECDKKRKEPTEIVLLDGKRSLNVNIFLKQFRSSNEDIIQLIRDGDHDDIGAEKLRGLLKILPELDESEMLRAFDGDKTKLGNAEKFLLQLIDIPNYKLRIESMLLKEEFASNMSYLEPSINSMIVAGEDLMTNKRFQEVLYMVICAGNFLNFGGYAGKAAGVKLSSLQKLTDIRANKPGMNLIHYVALQAEKNRKDLLKFPEEMSVLEEATKTTVEQLQNEINALDSRFKVVRKQIELPNTEQDIKNQMIEFLKIAERQVGGLQSDIAELESMRKTLADFFCEDVNTFKLEECFRIVHNFCMKFKLAVAENERRKVQEEQALVRRRQREEQLAVKKKLLTNDQHINGADVESNLVDSILYDIRSGFPHKKSFDKGKRPHNATTVTSEEDNISVSGSPAVIRRRLGVVDNPNKEDNLSPDVTPNGSLRRRRSRVPSEEDEVTLMDFLRTSNQDAAPPVSTIQRKSWGSLDRSWARRFRGSGKKRPELLSADFSADRERANSPSPLVESKPITSTAASTPEEESKPKAWRQKIEAWLQENEKEEKDSDDLRRKTQRIQSNRKSLENDSESDGRSSILDTLPEGKLADANNDGYKRVYSDWRPTIDKTDVVGVMEAIAEAQPQVKDKSQWRKSNLNVPNTSEETDTNTKRYKKPTTLSNFDSHSTPLHAIKEEDRRKGFIEKLGQNVSNHDRLTVYIRGTDQPEKKPHLRSPSSLRKQLPSPDSPEEKLLPPFAPRRKISDATNPGDVTDKNDIDSDNIETPPTSRRQIVRPQAIPTKIQTVEEEILGDGQFDRFSAARRTRRYRKSAEDDVGRKSEGYESPKGNEEPDVRLKKWKDKLMYKTPEDDSGNKDFSRNRLYSSMPRSTRNQSVVDHGDIMKAVKIYGQLTPEKSVVVEPRALNRVTKVNLHDNDESSIKMKSEFIPEIRVQALTPPIKIRTEHDLNDEGFEESVSLMSAESLSQETSSGNFETEKLVPKPIARADSSGSNDTVSSSGPVASTLRKTNSLKSSVKPAVRKTELPKRTSSFRGGGSGGGPHSVQKPATAVKVVASMIKPAAAARSTAVVQRPTATVVRSVSAPRPVERSGSRSSLRSSRSSLNSSNSAGTVKKKIPGIATYTRAINDLTTELKAKKPLNALQLHNRNAPAAVATGGRSGGAGSGIAVPKPKPKPSSASFKENLLGRPIATAASGKPLGFMRPTAASTAKDLIDGGGGGKTKPLVKKNFK